MRESFSPLMVLCSVWKDRRPCPNGRGPASMFIEYCKYCVQILKTLNTIVHKQWPHFTLTWENMLLWFIGPDVGFCMFIMKKEN